MDSLTGVANDNVRSTPQSRPFLGQALRSANDPKRTMYSVVASPFSCCALAMETKAQTSASPQSPRLSVGSLRARSAAPNTRSSGALRHIRRHDGQLGQSIWRPGLAIRKC